MVLLGHFPFGGRCKPWAVAKETKKKKSGYVRRRSVLLCHFIIASELQIMALVCRWICAKGLLHLLWGFWGGVFFGQELRIMAFLWHGPYMLSYSSPCLQVKRRCNCFE